MAHKDGVDRRAVLQALGASAALPVLESVGAEPLLELSGFHPLVPPQAGGWRARFLDRQQLEKVSVLCELIVPETDTPGARAAKVDQYVDFALSEDPPADQAFIPRRTHLAR